VNQAIQFPDREEWDAKEQAILFPALVNGMQLMCVIKGDVLLRRFGGDSPLRAFMENRWDLEEEASDLINDQQEDNQGRVWLS